MQRYEVLMQRTMTQQGSIVVEAESKYDAIKIAANKVDEIEWSATDSDYETSDVSEVV